MPTTKGKKNRPKPKLVKPDLEHSKAAVLRSLGSPDSRRGYQHAIDDFVAWYCSEPRLAFNKTVVLRYRIHIEERGLVPGTVNVRIPAVRRLALNRLLSFSTSPTVTSGFPRAFETVPAGYPHSLYCLKSRSLMHLPWISCSP